MEGATLLAPSAWAAHYIQVTAAMLLFGGALFPFYAGFGGGSPSPRTMEGLAVVLCLAVAVAVGLKIVDLTGDPASLFDASELKGFFLETSFGAIWLLRFALSLAAVAVALGLRPGPGQRSEERARPALLLLLSGLILLSNAGAGHAQALVSTPSTLTAIAWEGLHLLAAGAWIGGLLPLLVSIGGSSGAAGGSLKVLRSFSFHGQWMVGLLLLGGFATLAVLMGAWGVTVQALSASLYGDTLIVKHSLIAVMVVVAGVNRFILLPRLETGRVRIADIRWTISLECVLAALVIAAAITLSQTPPP
jgi:putative copper resistance protein D